ncbi:MAG: hypothetical protein WC125_08855 [Bacteroidales bacterium]
MENIKDFVITKHLISVLNEAGFNAFIVGGAVRDMILGMSPKDFDVVTSAPIDKIKELFPFPCHGKITEKFLVHAFKFEGSIFEIASFRDEGNISNRNDAPQQGTAETDVLRRDFTCNSIMWNPLTDEILDPLNGVQDIHDRVLRTTRDADIVFAEDPVRIFRAIRFQRKLGFSFGFEITNEMISDAMASQNADRCRNEIAKIAKITKI